MGDAKWDINECDCEEVGGSCRFGHDEIMRLRSQISAAAAYMREVAGKGAYLLGWERAKEEAARVAETHDSGMARLGGGLYDSDRHALRVRGAELAKAIRAMATPKAAD